MEVDRGYRHVSSPQLNNTKDEVEADIRLSAQLELNRNSTHFGLDWISIKNLFTSMEQKDQDELGIYVRCLYLYCCCINILYCRVEYFGTGAR